MLISCEMEDYGCEGGNANYAYDYIMKYGISDETCSSYKARGHTNGQVCEDTIRCGSCMNGDCEVPDKYMIYTVE